MFVLLSEFSTKSRNGLHHWLRRPHFGRMWARDHMQFETPHELCGFDNGAYSYFRKKIEFNASAFLRRLDVFWSRLKSNWRRCIVAVCPDIVQGGLRSLEFSLEWRLRVPEGLPWFLAVQDGMTIEDVSPHMDLFSGVFLGGSDEFKLQAYKWCHFAHSIGKKFHYGRCRSIDNVRAARRMGADSIDSSRPVRAWTHGERSRARKWLKVAQGIDDEQRLF